MQKICLVGTGSQARYVIENVKNQADIEIEGLVDLENKDNIGKKINGFDIKCLLSDITHFFEPSSCKIVVSYGNNLRKKEVVGFLSQLGYKFATIINSKSYISSFVEIDEGCIINANVTIMPNATIGKHVILHSGTVIEHDNVIGDYANLAPGVITAGNVTIGEGAYVYTNANIIPKITVGKWAVVGAAANVIKDVPDHSVVVGNPAQILK